MSPQLWETGDPGLEDRPAGAPVDGRVLCFPARRAPVLGCPLLPSEAHTCAAHRCPVRNIPPASVGTCQEGLAVPGQFHPDLGTLLAPPAEALLAHLGPATPGTSLRQGGGRWDSHGQAKRCPRPLGSCSARRLPSLLRAPGAPPGRVLSAPSARGRDVPAPVSAPLTSGALSTQMVRGWASEQTCLCAQLC